ncbi:MAG TPA: putative glycoside hydrolase, partial [Spirochaetota bacterium]|nr:putative glycoside hydrolase [Spirochaetota bacterium]
REIAVPISVDLYGFTAWYRFGNLIGQDIEEFAEIVDVISPMVYPSHYGTRFYMNGERRLRPYKIVRDSGLRSLYITDGTALIRPYLQAFNLLSPTWGTEYIQLQIKGARESGGSGFIFWNAGGNYEMVRKSFSK